LAYVLLLPVCLVVFSLAVGGLFLSRTNQAKLRAKAAAQKEVKTAQPSDEASRKILDRLKAADLTSMGTLLLNRNKSEEAFSAFNDAIHIYEHDPQPPIDQYTEALFGLAYCYQQAGNSIESVKYANRGLNITENVDGDLSPTLAFQLTFVGSSLLARGGRDADATFQVIKPFYERSLSIAAKIHKPGSTYLADLLSIQGRSCFTRNLLSEALPRLEKAELLYRAAAPKEVSEDTQLPSVINYLAQGYCQTKQYDKIPPICREMTSVYNSYDGKLKTKSAGLLLSTAELLRSCSIKTKNPLNAFRIAEHACQAVLPAYRASTDTERHALANLYETLGTVCCEEASLGGKEGHKSAEHWFREAIATRKAMAKPETLELARNIRSLGTVLAGQHKYSDARPLIDQGLYLSRKLSGSNSHDSAISLGCSAELYRAQGDFAKAEPLYTQAMRLCMQAPQSDTLEVAMIYAGLAACKRENGRDAEAIPLFDHARKIYLAKLGPRSLNFIWADTELKAVQAKLKGKKTSNQNRTDRELHG